MKVVIVLVILCIVTYCKSWGTRRTNFSVWRRTQTSVRRRPSVSSRRHGRPSQSRGRRQQCIARPSCCWDQTSSRCNCQSRSSRWGRGKRAGKIQVNKAITNCNCRGYEGGGHGAGPRPFRVVCSKSISSRKGNQKKKGECTKKNQNDCTYTGNPHPCRDYNKKQEKFYEELLATIIYKQCSNLNLPNSPCPTGTFNTARTCSDIDYIG